MKNKLRDICSWNNINVITCNNLVTIPTKLDNCLVNSAKKICEKSFCFKDINPSLSIITKLTGETILSSHIYNNLINFQKLFNKTIELKIQSHKEDSCKLFHYDSVFARLITTYFGPTTEVVEYDNVNWNQLGTDWNDFEEYNCRILKDRKNVINLEPLFSHILFGNKSDKHPCIHRAPDIECNNLKRLTVIMTIN